MNAAAEATARLVASHLMIGQASRPRMMPRAHPPDFLEAAYATRLVAEVQQWRDALAPLLADVPSFLASARHDSYRPGHAAQGDPASGLVAPLETARSVPFRADENHESRRARRQIEYGRVVVRQSSADLEGIAPRIGRQVADQQKQQLDRQLTASLGVAPPTFDRRVPEQIDHFVAQNVAKLRAIGDRTMDGVEHLIGEAYTSDVGPGALAAEIARRFDVAESYARRLAADQITKLNAQVRQARHLELGIELFRWETMEDSRVRPTHAVKNDRVFPYRGSRAPSFLPGEEYGCRCRAAPIVEGIKARALELAGRGRQRAA